MIFSDVPLRATRQLHGSDELSYVGSVIIDRDGSVLIYLVDPSQLREVLKGKGYDVQAIAYISVQEAVYHGWVIEHGE